MGFPILVRRHLYIESGPRSLSPIQSLNQCQEHVSPIHSLSQEAPVPGKLHMVQKRHITQYFTSPMFQITQTQDIFSLADAAWKHPKYPCFCILPLEFEVNIDIHKHKTVSLYIQIAINIQRTECLGTPDCKNTENMSIDFIWLNVQAKYLIPTILYHFKWDMAL